MIQSSEITISNTTNGKGYRYIHVRDKGTDERGMLSEHRLLAFAWREIDSVFFSKDMKEVHHVPINGKVDKSLNIESNIIGCTPKEHRDIDPERAKIVTPWDRLAVGD